MRSGQLPYKDTISLSVSRPPKLSPVSVSNDTQEGLKMTIGQPPSIKTKPGKEASMDTQLAENFAKHDSIHRFRNRPRPCNHPVRPESATGTRGPVEHARTENKNILGKSDLDEKPKFLFKNSNKLFSEKLKHSSGEGGRGDREDADELDDRGRPRKSKSW